MRGSPYLKIGSRPRSRCLINDFGRGLNTLFDEAALGYKAASAYCNFRTQSGVLTDGWGIEYHPDFTAASDACSVWEYARQTENGGAVTPMYCDLEGGVHEIKEGTDVLLSGAKFTSPPLAVGYRLYGEDVVLLCSETDGMAVYDGVSLYKVDASPTVTSMAVHYERLFVTTAGQRNSVRFSDDLDPTNWAEDLESGGFVELVDGYGKSNKVVSFLNYLYVFRDYGISRMTAYADQTQFSVSNLYVSSGRIYPNSVTVCGDRVIFLSSDGLKVFDGLSTKRLLLQLKDITPYKDSAVGRYHDGRYYLSYSAAGGANDSLLVYDLAGGGVELSSGFSLSSFVQGSSLAAICGGRVVKITPCGRALDAPTEKVWRVPLNSLQRPDKRKRLYDVYLDTATDITLCALADGRGKTLAVKGGGGVKRVRVNMSGRRLGLEIRCCSFGARVADVALIVGS